MNRQAGKQTDEKQVKTKETERWERFEKARHKNL